VAGRRPQGRQARDFWLRSWQQHLGSSMWLCACKQRAEGRSAPAGRPCAITWKNATSPRLARPGPSATPCANGPAALRNHTPYPAPAPAAQPQRQPQPQRPSPSAPPPSAHLEEPLARLGNARCKGAVRRHLAEGVQQPLARHPDVLEPQLAVVHPVAAHLVAHVLDAHALGGGGGPGRRQAAEGAVLLGLLLGLWGRVGGWGRQQGLGLEGCPTGGMRPEHLLAQARASGHAGSPPAPTLQQSPGTGAGPIGPAA
jgi:hypothetical protein